MADASTPNDAFKFVMIRGPRRSAEGQRSTLDFRRDLARRLASLPAGKRQTAAKKQLADAFRLLDSDLLHALESELMPAERSTAELRQVYQKLAPEGVAALADDLADSLIALVYAETQPDLLKRLSRTYRLATLAAGTVNVAGEPISVDSFLATPIVADGLHSLPRPEPRPLEQPVDVRPIATSSRLLAAIEELEQLDRSRNLVQPDRHGIAPANGGQPFSLLPKKINDVTAATKTLLANHYLDLARQPLTTTIAALEDLLWSKPSMAVGRNTAPPVAETAAQPQVIAQTPAPLTVQTLDAPLVQLRDVAQHFVVRQHLKRYEPIDIAHIQNVLPKETNSQTSRSLDRTETTRTSETEETEEHQNEHETADRLEVNLESARAVTEEAQMHANFTLAGRYGPSVEFTSELGLDSNTTTTQSQQFATSFAKSVTDRTVERVGSRFRTSLAIKVLSEMEETNVHTLSGPEMKPIRGIYQYVDKIYEAQLFDVGARTVADFSIPEPGAFLAAQRMPRLVAGAEIPQPPRLADHVRSQTGITEANFMALCALFGVADAPLPPPRFQTVAGAIRQPSEGTGTEEDQPKFLSSLSLSVPDTYQPWRLQLTGVLRTDDVPVLGIVLPSITVLWEATGTADQVILGGEPANKFVSTPVIHADLSSSLINLPEDSNLDVGVLSWETGMFAITVKVLFRRTAAAVAAWQGTVYRELQRGAERLDLAYQAALAERGNAARPGPEPRFGISPSEAAEIIRTELKRSCIAILLPQQQSAADENTFSDAAGTIIDGQVADAHARTVTFLEQAIEWENLQYIAYPYFWGRRSTWEDHVSLAEEQPEIKALLQSGAARVVVPLRLGFGPDFAMFLASNGAISTEQGGFVPSSYLPIDEELRARAGAGLDGTQVGAPWEVRMPTRLSYLRESEDLPVWSRPDSSWNWTPAN